MKTPSVSGLNEHQIIPHPCHQNWEDLEPREPGNKHCSECDCDVRDLTDMSTDDIYALREKLGGKLCGMIYKKDNYVTTEVTNELSNKSCGDTELKTLLTVPKIISGGIAALSLASCASPEVAQPSPERSTANAFPQDGPSSTKRGNPGKTKELPLPDCLLGRIVVPSRR